MTTFRTLLALLVLCLATCSCTCITATDVKPTLEEAKTTIQILGGHHQKKMVFYSASAQSMEKITIWATKNGLIDPTKEKFARESNTILTEKAISNIDRALEEAK